MILRKLNWDRIYIDEWIFRSKFSLFSWLLFIFLENTKALMKSLLDRYRIYNIELFRITLSFLSQRSVWQPLTIDRVSNEWCIYQDVVKG